MFAPDCVRKSALPDLLEIALLPCLVILAPAAAATRRHCPTNLITDLCSLLAVRCSRRSQ